MVSDAGHPSAIDAPDSEAGGARPESSSALLSRWGLNSWDVAAVLAAGWLLLAFVPPMMFDGWTQRMSVLIPAGLIGLVPLVRLAWGRDTPAVLLVAAIGWMLIAAVVSGDPLNALIGIVGRDLSALTVLLCGGVWALGRAVSEHGKCALAKVILIGAGANALIGLLQVVVDVRTGPLGLASGRPYAFMTNPVYFGAICAGGLALAAGSSQARPRPLAAAVIIILGVGVSLSGSRVALGAAVVTLGAMAVLTRLGPRLVSIGLGGAGLLLGVVLDRVVGQGRNAADRIAGGGAGGRSTIWSYGWEAWKDRPLTGYGFGRFRPAVQARFSSEFTRDFAIDETSQPWFDAHNVVVGVLVAVGAIGLVLFGIWALSAARTMRGPLAWGALPIVLTWLLQPVALATLPIVMLMVGAACRAPTVEDRRWSRVATALATVGVVLGAYLVVTDLAFRQAVDARDGDRAAFIARFYGRDSITSDVVAQVYAVATDAGVVGADEHDWRVRTAQAEPDRPLWWAKLALAEISLGQFRDAEVSVNRALELQPFSVRALRARVVLAARAGDDPLLAQTIDKLCELGQPECDIDPDELRSRLGTSSTDPEPAP
jgi:O-antigen ligase